MIYFYTFTTFFIVLTFSVSLIPSYCLFMLLNTSRFHGNRLSTEHLLSRFKLTGVLPTINT